MQIQVRVSTYWNQMSQSRLEVIKLLGFGFSALGATLLQLFTTKTNDIVVVVIGKPLEFDIIHFRVQQLVEHLDYFRE